jgi:hypothetical protein
VNDEQSTIPDYVLDDLEHNFGLVRRWAEDPGFRRQLLEADDTAAFAASQGYTLRAETAAWIRQRVEARGLAFLLGEEQAAYVVPF